MPGKQERRHLAPPLGTGIYRQGIVTGTRDDPYPLEALVLIV
jgi:hypothetical protein